MPFRPRPEPKPAQLDRQLLELMSGLLRLREEPSPLPAPNWSRPLPRPIIIPDVMELATLADVRILARNTYLRNIDRSSLGANWPGCSSVPRKASRTWPRCRSR